MNKKLHVALVIGLAVALGGCKSMERIFKPDTIIKTEYVEKLVPVYIIPAPPKVERPTLATSLLTPEQKLSLGELVKAYVVETEQLSAYASLLEDVIKKYEELSKRTDNKQWEIVLKAGRAEIREKQ